MSNAYDEPKVSAPNTGSGVLVVLKQKMQNLRDDLEKYKDMYEEKCEEAENERSRRNEVKVCAKRRSPISPRVARWLSGRASDLRSKGRGFEARP